MSAVGGSEKQNECSDRYTETKTPIQNSKSSSYGVNVNIQCGSCQYPLIFYSPKPKGGVGTLGWPLL